MTPVTPHASGFAGARTLISVQSERMILKSGKASVETRYYLSSLGEETPPGRLASHIRSHWGAVEINTHWKRDTLMGEDGTRSRRPVLIANLALMRNALLTLLSEHDPGGNLVQTQEMVQRTASLALRILRS